jgi:hypothetical protein
MIKDMPALERRGSYIYLALATLLVAGNSIALLLNLLGGWEQIRWGKAALSFVVIVGVIFLWRGNETLRQTIGMLCVVSGVVGLVGLVRVHWQLWRTLTPDEWNLLLRLGKVIIPYFFLAALLEIAVGLAIMVLPSVRAFLSYQRARYE